MAPTSFGAPSPAGTSYAAMMLSSAPDTTTQVFRTSTWGRWRLHASTGEVTFTHQRRCKSRSHHCGLLRTTQPYLNASTGDYLTLDADQLSVQQSITLTDGDGDTTNATAAFDLGGNFQIGDDGPALSITADDSSLGVAITYDGNTTTDGNYQGGNDAAAAGSTETTAALTAAQVAAVFSTTSAPGADGGSTGTPPIHSSSRAQTVNRSMAPWTSSDGTNVVWSEISAGTSYAGVLRQTRPHRSSALISTPRPVKSPSLSLQISITPLRTPQGLTAMTI